MLPYVFEKNKYCGSVFLLDASIVERNDDVPSQVTFQWTK